MGEMKKENSKNRIQISYERDAESGNQKFIANYHAPLEDRPDIDNDSEKADGVPKPERRIVHWESVESSKVFSSINGMRGMTPWVNCSSCNDANS